MGRGDYLTHGSATFDKKCVRWDGGGALTSSSPGPNSRVTNALTLDITPALIPPARSFPLLEANGLAFDLHANWFQLEDAAKFVAGHPTTRVVVDHLGVLKLGKVRRRRRRQPSARGGVAT